MNDKKLPQNTEEIIKNLRMFSKRLISAYTLSSEFATACEEAANYIEKITSPLSVQELQDMEIGDWVWIELSPDAYPRRKSSYYQKHQISTFSDNEEFWGCTPGTNVGFDYADYGKKWLAYCQKPGI